METPLRPGLSSCPGQVYAKVGGVTRRPFGGTTSDFVDRVSNTGALLASAGAPCKFYTAATGGVQVMDLRDSGGNATSVISADAYGMIPPFLGPDDGSDYLWVTAGGLNRQRMEATDLHDRIASLEAASTGFNFVGPKTANYMAAPGQFVLWDTTAASYVLTLPTAPADRCLIGTKIVTLGVGHTVTITCGGSDVFNKIGGSTTITVSLMDQAFQLEYHAGVWVVTGIDITISGIISALANTFDPLGAAVGIALVFGGL